VNVHGNLSVEELSRKRPIHFCIFDLRRIDEDATHTNERLHLHPFAHIFTACGAGEWLVWFWVRLWHIGKVGLVSVIAAVVAKKYVVLVVVVLAAANTHHRPLLSVFLGRCAVETFNNQQLVVGCGVIDFIVSRRRRRHSDSAATTTTPDGDGGGSIVQKKEGAPGSGREVIDFSWVLFRIGRAICIGLDCSKRARHFWWCQAAMTR
jgi:hypothetical protein